MRQTALLDGPGRHLQSVTDKWMVDTTLAVQQRRVMPAVPHQQAIGERLQKELLAQSSLPNWWTTAAMTEGAQWLPGLLDSVSQYRQPGHMALSLIAQALLAEIPGREPALVTQLEQLGSYYQQCATRLEDELAARGLENEAREHIDAIFARWRSGHYGEFSPAGRCYVVLEELRWGRCGAAVRLSTPRVRDMLLEEIRRQATELLAKSVDASTQTRHFYQQWLNSPPTPSLLDYKDTLSWLGNWSDSERQPVCWSVTQSWKSVALGMPRLCSASRLAGAMVDEVLVDSLAA